MIKQKLNLIIETLRGVEQDYAIAAKYFLFYRFASGFKWIDGGSLYRLIGVRTTRAMCNANKPRITNLIKVMVSDIKRLLPAGNIYIVRLAVPGRTCSEIAQILKVIDKDEVNAILMAVAARNQYELLAKCWEFWREERKEERHAG